MTKNSTSLGQWLLAVILAALMLVPVAASASAQATVTTSDIQRLQDEIFQAGSDLSRLRGTNRDLATRLQDDLDELRDEVVYLRVRLRREGNVPRAEYTDVRDRLQALRSEARGESTERRGAWTGGAAGGTTGGTRGGTTGGVAGGTTRDDRAQGTRQGATAIPVGQELDVRLQTQLSSATAQVEDRFEATTVADLYRGNEVLIPAGSVLRGVVRTVERATRTDRKGELTVSFDQISVDGRTYPMRGTVTQALESEGIRGEAGRIGAGAGVGAIIGGILGGVKGALLGVLIGGGGTIAATEGKDVLLEPGTTLRVRLDTPPDIR
jgi:TolA-binding protein